MRMEMQPDGDSGRSGVGRKRAPWSPSATSGVAEQSTAVEAATSHCPTVSLSSTDLGHHDIVKSALIWRRHVPSVTCMALSRHHAAFSRPLNVEEIVKEASNFEFHPGRPMQQWLRAAKMLLTEAAICEQDGNQQTAYLYMYRHCELVLTKLSTHPDYRDPRYKQELAQARKAVQKNLVKLEQWKPRINREHQLYITAMQRRNADRQRAQAEFNQIGRERQSFDQSRRGSGVSVDSVPASPTHALNANEHREFAVNLAQQEIRRRDATRQSMKQAGISPATETSPRQGIMAHDYFDEDSDSVSKGVREAGSYLQPHTYQSGSTNDPSSRQHASSAYRYPSIPPKKPQMEWDIPSPAPQKLSRPHRTLPPALPAKESLYDHQTTELSATPLVPPLHKPNPTTIPLPRPAGLAGPAGTQQPPSKYTFKPTAATESGLPLRTVLLPPTLRETFLALAHPNTLSQLETCGILAATVISNALFINHLIIPDQTSTSDTCDTTPDGDNALFDYCDAHSLLVCGWIHTHPTQSCFLSSRDLHTSSGYQVMLPEAIAIVCAPRHNPDWGIFRLTDPPGLGHILDCTKPGVFHPHSESHLYTDALRPGHVVEGPGLQFEVVDLRK